jgi:cobyrinic acid a,c-diamide synthase
MVDGINVIEGNRGLFDGVDEDGTHSSAELSKLLQVPIILVINVTKMSRTVAAFILGCKMLDPDIRIAGVVLNKVGSSRHERVIRKAIEKHCSIPVVGAIRKIKDPYLLPDRHLGLVTPEEHMSTDVVREKLTDIIKESVDIKKIEEIALSASPLEVDSDKDILQTSLKNSKKVKIAYFYDSAFTFYYPENLEALRDEGAEPIPVSALKDKELPQVDGLYIGGGFPETHSKALAENHELLVSVREHAERGLPIYAECGGMIYLSRTLFVDHKEYPLAGILPIDVKMNSVPAGHGYCQVLVDKPNPFFSVGTKLCGHEFHYTSIIPESNIETAYTVTRGTGSFKKRDGIVYKNILAGYTHLHALSTPEWAKGLVKAACNFESKKEKEVFYSKNR